MSAKNTNTTANQTACGSKLNNSMSGKQKQQRDIYQEITDKIVAALETGVAPWVKPWSSCGAPRNAVTGREYSGVNLLLLGMAPYSSPLWLTYKQAQDVGGQVRKGEHGTTVVLFKPLAVKDAEAEGSGEEEGKGKVIPMLRTFTVFNVEQIDGLPEKYTNQKRKQLDSFTDIPAAEAVMSLARVELGKSKACFIPSLDVVHLPEKTAFRSVADFYATGMHEMTHWTGHKSRLARDFSGRFGDAAYAFEELIAELGAAFLCAHCGIDGQLQHESYIASWLKVLKNDKRAIFAASAAARRAAEFLIPAQEQEQAAA